MKNLLEALGPGSEVRIQDQLDAEAAASRAARQSPADSSAAIAKAYPGVGGSIQPMAGPTPAGIDSVRVIRACVENRFAFEPEPAELEAIRAFVRSDAELVSKIDLLGPDVIAAEYKRTPPPLEGRPPVEEAIARARKVRSHLKEERRKLAAGISPTVVEMLRRARRGIEPLLEVEAERHEAIEHDLGLDPSESRVVLALRGALAWLDERIRAAINSPEDCNGIEHVRPLLAEDHLKP